MTWVTKHSCTNLIWLHTSKQVMKTNPSICSVTSVVKASSTKGTSWHTSESTPLSLCFYVTFVANHLPTTIHSNSINMCTWVRTIHMLCVWQCVFPEFCSQNAPADPHRAEALLVQNVQQVIHTALLHCGSRTIPHWAEILPVPDLPQGL